MKRKCNSMCSAFEGLSHICWCKVSDAETHRNKQCNIDNTTLQNISKLLRERFNLIDKLIER